MTTAEHEALIDRHERLMLEANSREDRIIHAAAFLSAINARNAERTAGDVAEIERQRGLR